MASGDKVTLQGFEAAHGEPWRSVEDFSAVSNAHKKSLVSWIDEHLTGAQHEGTYKKKRVISIDQCVELALQLDLSGVEGASDAVADNSGTLATRLTALKELLEEGVETDDEDDEPPKRLDWLKHSLTAPAQKYSVLLLETEGVDVATHGEALAVLRKEAINVRRLTHAQVKDTIKEWLAKHKDTGYVASSWKALDGKKEAPAAEAKAAWTRVLMEAMRRAKKAAEQRNRKKAQKQPPPNGSGGKKANSKGANGAKVPPPPTASVNALQADVESIAAALEDVVNDVESIDVAKARKRAKMKAELKRIREGAKDRGFVKHAYRQKGNETMKPRLLARWKTARARELTLELEAENDAGLLAQPLWQKMLKSAQLEMSWCDLEAEKGATLLDAIAKKRRDEEAIKDLGDNAEESKNIMKWIREHEAETKKKEAAEKEKSNLVAAFTSAIKTSGGQSKRKAPSSSQPAQAGEPKKKKRRRNRRNRKPDQPKPGDPDFTGCKGIFCDSGKRCGGDHYAGQHWRDPEKYGGKIKPKPKTAVAV